MLIKGGIIGLIVVFSCLLGVVRGSCAQYGHSCLGGHGKRAVPFEQHSTTIPKYKRQIMRLLFDKLTKGILVAQQPEDDNDMMPFIDDRIGLTQNAVNRALNEPAEEVSQDLPLKRLVGIIASRI